MTGMVNYSDNLNQAMADAIAEIKPDKVFVLTDTNVSAALGFESYQGAKLKIVPAGETTKTLATATELWQWMAEAGAGRRSLLFNLGGGMVTDLGGFVAATFKRGIRFVNIPTTILAAADAAIGGKTGVNFMGYKNEVGVFAPAECVIIIPALTDTLPETELKSGFAEIVKTAMISDSEIYNQLLAPDALHDKETMARAMRHAAEFKQKVVSEDPTEKGLRKILNFGHTAGHAYEEYSASTGHPISHGEAVAHGILYALRLSHERLGLDVKIVDEYEEKILKRYYNPLPFGPEADEEIRRLMAHDKKNSGNGQISFVLLASIGNPVW